MINAVEAMRKILEKCEIFFGNAVISREHLLREFADFLLKTHDKERHNVGIVLHTGSICFDAMLLIYAVASCLAYNEIDTDDIISSLEIGQSVLYGEKKQERYVFEGVVEHPMIKEQRAILLTQGPQGTTYVPQGRWRYIRPYFGSATTLDGRGIRKSNNNREWFLNNVFGYSSEDIVSVTEISVPIVMPRDRAEMLLDNLKLFYDGKFITPLELVTASYFTENEEHRYSGNAGRTEANIKFTCKVSVAREMVLRRDGNRHIGVVIAGDESVSRGQSEIPELLRRRSIQYVYVSVHMDSEHADILLSESEDASVFACTKEFLLWNSKEQQVENTLCQELSSQVDAVLDHEIHPVILEGDTTRADYQALQRALLTLKRADIGEEADEFIIQAYSLIRLFKTAVFQINVLEKCIEEGKINIVLPSERINRLSETTHSFPESLKSIAHTIVDFLQTAYLNSAENKSRKEEELREILRRNHMRKIAIVVPKAYYEILFRECEYYHLMDSEELLTVVPVNKFDRSIIYDRVIVLGDYSGKRFQAARCHSTRCVTSLLYEYESYAFSHKIKLAQDAEKALNARIDGLDVSWQEEKETMDAAVVAEAFEIEREVDELVERLNETMLFRNVNLGTRGNQAMADIVAVGKFDNGDRAFFTKNYKPYVFNKNAATAEEVKVAELKEGDCVIFTQHGAETRDIVDVILSKLIRDRKLSQDIISAYGKSKTWKNELIEYMQVHELSAKEVVERMIQNGVNVQEITIRTWLDEDAHTIGPREVESIQQIALLTGDDEMFEHAQEYHTACSVIRKIRREILKKIGQAMIDKLCGREAAADTVIAEIYDRLDSIALVLQLDSITYVEKQVPINMVNRPLNTQEA